MTLYRDESIIINLAADKRKRIYLTYWYEVIDRSTGNKETIDIRTLPLYEREYKTKSQAVFIVHDYKKRAEAVSRIILDYWNQQKH